MAMRVQSTTTTTTTTTASATLQGRWLARQGRARTQHSTRQERRPLSAQASPKFEATADPGDDRDCDRRSVLARWLVAMAGVEGVRLFEGAPVAQAIAERPVEVSNYLPPSSLGLAGFYEFVPGDRETPAIRAGTISKYKFSMPGSWIRRTVANILSGNYCQPRCDEPWTEVLFTDPQEGSLQVIVAPLNKLSRQSLAEGESIDKVGTMEGIINALGPNITGNTIEEEEVVSSEAKTIDGVTYYWYTLNTPYAKTGQHQVATIAAKDNAVFVLAVSASDKQWSQNKGNIRTIAESFRI